MGSIGRWKGPKIPYLPLGATPVAYLICGGSKGPVGLPVAQPRPKQAPERTRSNHTHYLLVPTHRSV